MFMDNLFHNNGLDVEPFNDLGRGKTNDYLTMENSKHLL